MIHSSLDHPNVVRMEDTFEDDDHVYFKLELCRAGVSIAQRASPKMDSPLTLPLYPLSR